MAKPINYKQVFARKRDNEARILKLCPKADHTSGIYVFYREQDGFRHAYVGLATKSLLRRLAEHLDGYEMHIDKSIRKYGLFDAKENLFGYKVAILCHCPPDQCNEKEQFFIKKLANDGWQMKNTTGGSQGEGKVDINERKEARGYHDGLTQGEKKTKEQVKTYFDKYLDFVIKPPTGKVKERKFQEFADFLNGTDKKD